MSESSPQLAQFLFPTVALSALSGAPGQLRAGGLQGLSANRADNAPTPVNAGFQQQLQALLDDQATAAATGAGFISGVPLALAASGQPGVAGFPPGDPRAATGQVLTDFMSAGGKQLPEGGKSLPPGASPGTSSGSVPGAQSISLSDSAALNALRSERAAALAADSAAVSRDAAIGPLNSGRPAVAEQLTAQSGVPSALSGVNTAANEAASETDQRMVSELQRQPFTGRDPGLRIAADSAASQSAAAQSLTVQSLTAQSSPGQSGLPAGSNPLNDLFRRMQAADTAGERTSAASADARLAELGALSGRADGGARVTATTDAAAAQFNLHTRPEGLMQPATMTADQALRDLSSLAPLRPQSGEGATNWSAGLGQRLLMMADNGIETARLRLNPANLGPLEIHVNVEDDQARVWFGAQHSATRDALEAALPRLRAMFAEQGLELAHADVGERGAGNDKANSDHANNETVRDDAASVAAAATVAADHAQLLSDGHLTSGGIHRWGAGGGGLDIYV